MTIRIDQEFQSLIPPLRPEELTQLEANILAEGIRDPLVTWRGVLIDGHNRYAIARKHGITYTAVEREFADRVAVADWIDRNQLGRRNLHPDQYALVIGRIYNRARRQGQRTDLTSGNSYQKSDGTTAERIAANHGLSEKTVRNAGDFAAAVDRVRTIAPTIEADVATGAAPARKAVIRAADLLDRNPEAAAAILRGEKTMPDVVREERRARSAEEAQREVRDEYAHAPQIIHARFQDADVGDETLDAIITDPPYPKEYLPVYADLAAWAARKLKPGGSAFVMCGQAWLPEVFAHLTSDSRLSYRWTLAYLTPGGQSVQVFPRTVNTFWKPVLWLVKGDYLGDWLGDVAQSKPNDNDKRFHEWGQSESGMADLIRRGSRAGDVVCDPFAGGGTTISVAAALGRRTIAIECDSVAFETLLKRVLP
jgi:site-specific DNA-methyltransferase (adenine-specific)